jgi:hypothetical protein
MKKKIPKRLTKKQKRMQRAIKYMADYMATYAEQGSCMDYSDEMFIDDIIYGLGVALDKKYEYADGFGDFKEVLSKHLSE